MFMDVHEVVADLLLYHFSEGLKSHIRRLNVTSPNEIHSLREAIKPIADDKYQVWSAENPYTMKMYTPMLDYHGVDVNPKHPDNFLDSVVRMLISSLTGE